MSVLHTAPTAADRLRDAWIAIGLTPVALVLAVGVAFAFTGSGPGASWIGGAILAIAALAAPTYALVAAHSADAEHLHGATAALVAAVVAWLLVVAVLVLAVVSPIAALVAIAVSACVVLLGWRPSGAA